MAKEGRSILALIFKNFIQSFKPKQLRGNLMGTDYLGTKYYEIPADPSIGRRKPSRWFEPEKKDDFEQELPAEWESWLRGRRDVPPLEEEIQTNLEIMQLKKKNAAELEKEKRPNIVGLLEKEKHGMESFPKYSDYECAPGKSKDNK